MSSVPERQQTADSTDPSVSSERSGPSRRRRRKWTIGRMALGLLLFGVPILLLLPWIAQPHVIVGDSMAPTLRGVSATASTGDVVTVNRWAYLFSPPARWSLIVFDRGDGKRVKRVVGLPGETVEIRSGSVVVNGAPMASPDSLNLPYHVSKGKYGHEPLRLRAGEYCVLGDNSYESNDSRIWGALPEDAIIGECVLRVWPLGRVGRVR